ncbi:hypothetical protein JWH11_06810 [Xanthomonas melonis]|uniref:Uncharacterized protein n=1 Tax=Xanthomonas melonis TaxID=56456 RepID=A0A2S7DMW8_9XANT|nr:hypothetical protein [Xanthomonas melonis]MCD0266153.1 hypothetical protein [Xanthomonas melonis]PPU75117.1 hypothetical protein XmelCFBP4644_04350 [Xanthomonas melonis]
MKTSATESTSEPTVMRLLSAAERQAQQRRAVRRTAITVGVVALLIYIGFIASGVIGR